MSVCRHLCSLTDGARQTDSAPGLPCLWPVALGWGCEMRDAQVPARVTYPCVPWQLRHTPRLEQLPFPVDIASGSLDGQDIPREAMPTLARILGSREYHTVRTLLTFDDLTLCTTRLRPKMISLRIRDKTLQHPKQASVAPQSCPNGAGGPGHDSHSSNVVRHSSLIGVEASPGKWGTGRWTGGPDAAAR